jgi:serine/alanine adding enzyme
MPREAVYGTRDRAGWNAALPLQDSVFGSVEFAGIVEDHLGYGARLYVLGHGDGAIAYPFFCRPIRPLGLGNHVDGRLTDIVSPEFTGPIARGGPAGSIARDFPQRFSAFAAQRGVVAEFIHLHPWNAVRDALVPEFVQFSREIVYVDLTWPEERLWQASFSHACRKNIARARQENVRVFEARTMDDIREFHRLYIQTMKDRNALPQYYFPLDYFRAVFERLGANARFVLADYKNQLIAGTLYLHDREDVYSYLGGADYAFQHVRPTNAVIFDTILWGQRRGKKRLVLGGGYSPNDGIFRFKSSFSPNRAAFHVYKRVHLPEQYDALCKSWSSTSGQRPSATAYFPHYRSSPDPGLRQPSASS